MLIACASVANMMLARAAARRREMAVRLALGASRARIIRQLIAESMLITGAAAVIGFLGCVWLMHALTGIQMPFPMPMSYGYLGPDGRVLLMTLVFTTVTGVLFGLVPARQALRTGLSPALKEGGHVLLGRYRWLTLRNVLIVSQVAGSLTLLVILGLLSAGIQNTLGVQTGFDPAHLSMLSLDPVRDGYAPDRAADLLQRVLERVQSLPSVTAAALTESVPVAMALDSVTVSNAGNIRRAIRHVAGKDYFTATRIPILNGRAFRREDETGLGTAIIVSAAFAAEVFRGVDPVGRRLTIGIPDPSPATTLPGSFDYRSLAARPLQTVEIVGVAGDVAEGLIAQKPRPAIYFPLRAEHIAHPSIAGLTLVVRSVPGIDAISLVRREIAAIDPNVATFNPRTMQEHVDKFMAMLRVASWTYGLIGIFGYVLAGVGLAGVTAYAVQQRRREIGIRMALGARPGGVLGLVMREGAVLVAIGTALGLAGAWAGSRGLAAMNHTVGTVTSTRPDDPFVIVGATALLAVMALLACYLPARQTTRIDPALALRQE
jgi:predicted permease